MTYQVAHTETKESHLNWLYKVSGASAFIVGGLLAIGAVELILAVLLLGTKDNWLSPFQNNWLIVLFKLHANFGGAQFSLLDQLNLLDIVILALIATMLVGLYMALRGTNKLWSLIALAQPILGMVIFIATKTAGRSSVMGAELVISMVMKQSQDFDKQIAYLGILSGVLLFAGDLSASMAPSNFLAILMGVGYTLLVIWLFTIGRRQFHIRQND